MNVPVALALLFGCVACGSWAETAGLGRHDQTIELSYFSASVPPHEYLRHFEPGPYLYTDSVDQHDAFGLAYTYHLAPPAFIGASYIQTGADDTFRRYCGHFCDVSVDRTIRVRSASAFVGVRRFGARWSPYARLGFGYRWAEERSFSTLREPSYEGEYETSWREEHKYRSWTPDLGVGAQVILATHLALGLHIQYFYVERDLAWLGTGVTLGARW